MLKSDRTCQRPPDPRVPRDLTQPVHALDTEVIESRPAVFLKGVDQKPPESAFNRSPQDRLRIETLRLPPVGVGNGHQFDPIIEQTADPFPHQRQFASAVTATRPNLGEVKYGWQLLGQPERIRLLAERCRQRRGVVSLLPDLRRRPPKLDPRRRQRTLPRLLQVNNVGAGLDRIGNLGGISHTDQQQRPRSTGVRAGQGGTAIVKKATHRAKMKNQVKSWLPAKSPTVRTPSVALNYESINTADQLQQYCDKIDACPLIAFDTEFVSEDSYRPHLCLIQVAADDGLAIIDPVQVENTEPFWQLLTTPGRTVIAHAAREEVRFCYRFTGKPIAGLFDTQLAAGFVGMEYPASLGTLVQRLVNKTLPKGETRTNWSRRPLSKDQITYALQDVTDLMEMYRKLHKMVDKFDRQEWLREETEVFQQKVIDGETRENWRRVSGSSGLNPRQLETVRQLWLWRENRARNIDRLPRRVLRDDLIVELARRGLTDQRKNQKHPGNGTSGLCRSLRRYRRRNSNGTRYAG